MSIFRLTGVAGEIKSRSGTNDRGPWSIRSQAVVLAPLVATDVSLPDGFAGYGIGEELDVAVEVTAKGGYLNVEVRDAWPKPAAHVRAAS